MERKNQQPPMSVDEQVANLNALGLQINDENYAKSVLNDISYFRLIKAYGLGLKNKNSAYDGTVTFEQIVELYLFNANFRQILFTEIEQIEVNLRCRIANHFSCKYGVLGYENPDNFLNAVYHEDFLNSIKEEIARNSKAPFVKNFRENYTDGKIPFYALIELFSFGTLSKFYKNMKSADKKAVAAHYGTGYTYLESWFEHLAFVRNICAHYGRLYNMNFPKTPTMYKQYTKQGIGNIRVFASLICMKHLLPNDRHWTIFIDKISLLFDKYPNAKIELMGFPENWKEILNQPSKSL